MRKYLQNIGWIGALYDSQYRFRRNQTTINSLVAICELYFNMFVNRQREKREPYVMTFLKTTNVPFHNTFLLLSNHYGHDSFDIKLQRFSKFCSEQNQSLNVNFVAMIIDGSIRHTMLISLFQLFLRIKRRSYFASMHLLHSIVQ